MAENLYMVIVYVPVAHADAIRKTLEECHAGCMGNYDGCSFSTTGIGRFRPNAKAHPAIGRAGKLEEVEEERIETVVEEKYLKSVLTELKKTHPYEEPAIHILSMLDYKKILES